MPGILELIDEISRKVAEDYILFGKDMNPEIVIMSEKSGANLDTVKRICEKANQNVYLAKFNDDATNKKNIEFDMADFKSISSQLKESEQAMEDYDTIPIDFKSSLNISVDEPTGEVEILNDDGVKLAELDIVVDQRNKYAILRRSVETMKVAEINEAKENFSAMFHDAKILVSNGDSIANMAKLAMRRVKEDGLDMNKIAKVYDLILEEMKKSGFSVNEELTKVSSLAINHKSELYTPIIAYSLNLEKIAAFNTMLEGIDHHLNAHNRVLKSIA